MINRVSKEEIQEVTSISISEITEHDRDEMAIPTYMHQNPLIRWLMWKRYDCLATMLDINSGAAMEFGCGIGLFLSELDKHYSQVFAIDLYPQYAMKMCEKKNINVTFLNDLSDIEDGTLDVVIAADVLEHIEELDEYLKHFDRILKPGGRFLISGPTENLLYKLGRLVAGFGDKADYHHTNIYHLLNSIEKFGFKKGTVISLPFTMLPSLFKICSFQKVK
ncbi:MAG: class I SAM-dependent methyltransferase [Gammaproteobacteria bacterium]|jgi:2-polyprenyl-3-methyl-5-hydroxy-6-metoxy-1,4-benzoquinol methylase